MAGDTSVVSVSEYTSALKRRWWLILLCAALGAIAGLFLLGLKTKTYVSEAKVEVRPLIVEGDSPNLDINRQVSLTTERSIAGSQRVAERALALIAASDELGIDDLDDAAVEEQASRTLIDGEAARVVAENITVVVPNDSHILVISGEHTDSERAREITEAVAYAYLDFRREAGLAATTEAVAQLEASEAALLEELDELARQMGKAVSETELQALSYRDISQKEQLAGIGSRLANLSIISVDPGYVLDDPARSDSTAGLPPLAGPLSGALLGASLGVAAAYFADRKDDRFRSVGTELTRLGLRPVGEVPVGRGMFKGGSGSVIAEFGSPISESYRRVQGSLMFNLDKADKSLIMVSGVDNPHSTTTVAANLAVAAARAGRRTLLIGADLRRPSLHDRFGLENGKGLTDVVSRTVNFEDALLTPTESTNLQLLTAGTSVDQPARLFQGTDFGRFIDDVKPEFDLIVFEAPPVLQVADAVDIARMCEGVVLVVEPGRTGRSAVADSLEQLNRVGADVVGTIVAENTKS